MPRVRTIFPSHQIPHLWRHAAEREAYNPSKNFYFINNTIYSYDSHFPIATKGKHNGRAYVFFTTRGYGNTTARHISRTRQAIPSSDAVFFVSRLSRYGLTRAVDVWAEYAASVKQAKANLAAFSKNGHASHRLKAWGAVKHAISEANRFAEFFGRRERFKLPKDAAELDKQAADYAAKLEASQAKASVTRAESRSAQTRQRQAQQSAYYAEREKQAAERAARMPELIAAWQAGESNDIPYDLPTMLRVSANGAEVETSKGASFPLDHVLRVLPLLERLINAGYTWNAKQGEGETCFRLGHYRIDKITADGALLAGCHTIGKAELLRFAAVLRSRFAADIAAPAPVPCDTCFGIASCDCVEQEIAASFAALANGS